MPRAPWNVTPTCSFVCPGKSSVNWDAAVNDARRLNEAIVHDLKLFDWMGCFVTSRDLTSGSTLYGMLLPKKIVWAAIMPSASGRASWELPNSYRGVRTVPRRLIRVPPAEVEKDGRDQPHSSALLEGTRSHPIFGWIYTWVSPPEHFFMCQE
jgi:hypothetical protein